MLKPLFTNTNFQLIHPSLHPILSPYPSHLHGFSPSPSPSPYSSRILSFSPCPYPILCFLSLHPSFSLSFSPLLIPPSLHPSIPPSLLSLHPSILYGNGSFAFYESFFLILLLIGSVGSIGGGGNGSFAFYESFFLILLLNGSGGSIGGGATAPLLSTNPSRLSFTAATATNPSPLLSKIR